MFLLLPSKILIEIGTSCFALGGHHYYFVLGGTRIPKTVTVISVLFNKNYDCPLVRVRPPRWKWCILNLRNERGWYGRGYRTISLLLYVMVQYNLFPKRANLCVRLIKALPAISNKNNRSGGSWLIVHWDNIISRRPVDYDTAVRNKTSYNTEET